MQHSVWNWDKVQYDYFQSNTPNSVGGWRPLTGLGVPTRSNVRSRGGVGVDIEAVLPSLPVGAKYIGSGPQAVGQICRRRPMRQQPVAGLGSLGSVSEFVLGGLDEMCGCAAKAKIMELNALANRNIRLRDQLMLLSATAGPDAVAGATQAETRRQDAIKLRDWIYGVQAWGYQVGVPKCEQWMEQDIDCSGRGLPNRPKAKVAGQPGQPKVGVAPLAAAAAAQVTLSVGTLVLGAGIIAAIAFFITRSLSDTAGSEAAAASLEAATQVMVDACSDPTSQACRDARVAVEQARQDVLRNEADKNKNSLTATVQTVAWVAGIGGLAYLAYRVVTRPRVMP